MLLVKLLTSLTLVIAFPINKISVTSSNHICETYATLDSYRSMDFGIITFSGFQKNHVSSRLSNATRTLPSLIPIKNKSLTMYIEVHD